MNWHEAVAAATDSVAFRRIGDGTWRVTHGATVSATGVATDSAIRIATDGGIHRATDRPAPDATTAGINERIGR